MNTQFSDLTLLSVYQWADNYLLQNGQAFTNVTTQLYYQADPVLDPQYVAYAAPFRSWVWDSGVSGANIINGVSGSITLGRGQSGTLIDFVNGRVLLPAAAGTGQLISGSYAFKDFNLYFANQTAETMVFANKYYLNARFTPTGGLPPTQWNPLTNSYNMVTPCIFVTNANVENKPFIFGGVYNTTTTISLNVLAENMGQLEGCLSLFTDAQDVAFVQTTPAQWPLNFYNDYKNGSGYNYVSLVQQFGTPANQYNITSVKVSKVSDYAKMDESTFLGLVDITVVKPRRIRPNGP